MAGSSNDLVKYGLMAGAAYLAYQWWSSRGTGVAPDLLWRPPVTAGGGGSAPAPASGGGSTSTAPPASTGTAPTPTTTPAPSPVAFNSLDAIYARLAAAVGTAPLTADGFDYSLSRELPAGIAAPDPLLVFNASGTWDRAVPMTLSQYWGAVAPYLRANLGLSGLGVFGGLGSLVLRYR